jgi:hypothetical protein
MMMRYVRLFLVALVAVTLLSFRIPAGALPSHSTEITYYHCSSGLGIGGTHDTCGGQHFSWGQTTQFDCGTIREEIVMDCRTYEQVVTYYRFDGCNWYMTSNPPYFPGCACPC